MPKGVRLNPKHDERTRAKIQTSQIINRLESFVNGEIEMSAPQVTAATTLLKKTLPDLQSTEMKVTDATKDIRDYSEQELLDYIRRGEGASGEEAGEVQPDKLH